MYPQADTIIKGAYYHRDQFDGQELPPVYSIVKPDGDRDVKRWFPAYQLKMDIENHKKRIDEYNTLKTTYDSALATYNTAVGKTETLKRKENTGGLSEEELKATIPTRPDKPVLPMIYNGLHLVDKPDGTEAKKITSKN